MEEEYDIPNSSPSTKDQYLGDPYLRKLSEIKGNESPMVKTTKEAGADVYGYNTGIGASSYDEGILPTSQIDFDDFNASLEDFRSKTQPWYDKVAAGTLRATNKAVAEIAKMPGVIGGLASAPFAEEGEGMETAFNNEWIKTVNKISENINTEYLPVYVKKAVKEGNLWDNISSVDFWATEGADGIGYIASMLAPGAALKSLNVGSNLTKLASMSGKTDEAISALSKLGLTPNNIDVGAATIANTLFESASEAGSAMENFQKELDFKLESGEIDEVEYQEMLEQKALLGRDVFVSNAAILLGPNAMMSKMLWGSKVNKKVGQLVNSEGQIIDNVVNPSLWNKLGNRAKNITSATASEGFFEEGMQSTVETMFTDAASKGELTQDYTKNFNVGDLTSNYLDTISSTEGQKAIFLGGLLGGGMYAYQGAKQDIRDRNATNNLLHNANNGLNSFYSIFNNDSYIKNMDGSYVTDSDGNLIQDPNKVVERAEALNNLETLNDQYNQAVASGNTETIEAIRKVAGVNLALNFINNNDLGLDLLKQHLQSSNQINEIVQGEQVNGNQTTRQETIDSIINIAEKLQENKSVFDNFAPESINPKDADPELLNEFVGKLQQSYINNKAKRLLIEDRLKVAEENKRKFLEDFGIAEDVFDKNNAHQKELRRTNSRFKKIDDDIKTLTSQLDQAKELDNKFWNDEIVQGEYDRFVKTKAKLVEDTSPENVAEVNKEIEEIQKATTEKEVDDVNIQTKTSAKPIVEQIAENKKQEISQQKQIQQETDREQQKLEEGQIANDMFSKLQSEINTLSNYKVGKTYQIPGSEQEGKVEEVTDSTITFILEDNSIIKLPLSAIYTKQNNPEQEFSTEGSLNSDLLIPQEGENLSTSEKDKNAKVIAPKDSVVDSMGAKVISTNKNTGAPITWIQEQFPGLIEYERNPINKVGKEVGFEINIEGADKLGGKYKEALNAFNNRDFSNMNLLVDYLPMNVLFEDNIKGPIETFPSTVQAQEVFNNKTKILRLKIIDALSKGISVDNITTIVQGQYKGILQIDYKEQGIPENSLLDLDYIRGDYSKLDFRMVNQNGELQSLNGQTQQFNNNSKIDAAGEIYIMIPQANGELFPLKINIKKINNLQADTLFELYKARLLQDTTTKSTTLGELSKTNPDLVKQVKETLHDELEVLNKKYSDITIKELTDLLVWDGTNNLKTRVRLEGAKLLYGNKEIFRDDIDGIKDDFIQFLTTTKRQHIKFKRKANDSVTIPTLENPKYVKYLVDNRILNTNAVVNEPTFQGFTNIYLNTNPTIVQQVNKPIVNAQIIKEQPFIRKAIPAELSKLKFQNEYVLAARYILRSDVNDGRKSELELIEMLTSSSKKGAQTIINKLIERSKLENGFDIMDSEIDSILNISSIEKQAEEYWRNNVDEKGFPKEALSEVIKRFKENNQQNPLSSKENFVPLHEYPETMENKQAEESIEKGYEIIPGTGRQYKNDIDSLLSYQEDIDNGIELSKEDMQDYNNLREKYTKPLDKKC